MSFLYIETKEALISACQQFRNSPFLCVDTEFHRETTYYPELALIQLGDEKLTVCIDPLVLDDLSPILELFTDTKIQKVFHACSQDLEIFSNEFGVLPDPIFDTQIAAALLGYGEQIGYAALIKDILNVDVDKSQTRTDWMKRPLNEKQIEYAGNDVFYLAQAFPKMLKQLQDLGRLNWLENDFKALSLTETFSVKPTDMWRKAKGHQRLGSQQLAILQAVASWREQAAQSKNRPRRRVLPDDALIDMVKQKPDSSKKLLGLRSLNRTRLSHSEADELVECIQQGLQMPKDQWPSLPKKHKTNAMQDALVDVLTAVLKLNASKHNINHASLATRKQLEALVRGERDLPIMNGWRKTHAGEILIEFIEGKLYLATEEGLPVIRPVERS
jgi:ribonuclease D